MTCKCVIVDDEPLAHKVLQSYIDRTAGLLLVKQCYTAEDARQYLLANPVDILFLDIEMPEETGIQLLQSLPQKPVTIFTTAFLHYSLEGYDLGVMDYLVKPVRYERFERAVKKATEFLALLQFKHNLDQESTGQSGLLIKTGNKKITVSRSSITHVQALKDYAILYCEDTKYVVRSTMKEMEELLGVTGFLRVHKSFIISKTRARFFASGKIEFENFEIPVGRKYRKAIEDYLRSANPSV
ncbi:MAG TPA: LytTR family DNA-binding domain-containing protein [Ferruginibacter sp.]|nr:LytTR family DNA-binding domain-containing protein [Ferruginibacter sp.]